MELPLPNPGTPVIEPFAELDLPALAGPSPSAPVTVRSAAVCSSVSRALVYLGTGGGKLFLFSVDPAADREGGADAKPAEFLRLISVSSSAIASILVLSEIGHVVALSDGVLYLCDLHLSRPSRRIGSVGEVSAVAKRVPCAAAAGLDGLLDFQPKAETLGPGKKLLQKLSGGVRAHGSNAWHSELLGEGKISCCILAAAATTLVLIEIALPADADISSGSENLSLNYTREIPGIYGASVKALAWVGDSIFVGTSSGYFLYSSNTGRSREIFSFPEPSGSPLLKSLVRSKEVLLLMDNVGVIADGLGQPVGGSLIFRCAPDFVVELSSYIIVAGEARVELYRKQTGVCVQTIPFVKAGSGVLNLASDEQSKEMIVIATHYKVVCYRKVPAEEQIKTLLRKKHYDEAINLAEDLESDGQINKNMLSFIHAQVGFLLFSDLRFEDAVDHFLLSEVMQPSEIFPFIMREPNRWSALVPRKRYWGFHPPPKPLEEVIDEGLIAVEQAMFLKKAGVDTNLTDDFLANPPSRTDLLELAIKNFIRYFRFCRDKNLSSAVLEGVDTLLMYLYRALDLVEDMEELASSPNSCIVDELEPLLSDSGHLRTLAFLYGSKTMCSKALAIWQLLARNYSTGLWRDHASPSTSILHDSSTETVPGQMTAAIEASKILKSSSDQELVLEHLRWIADIDEELAVAVLTSEERVNQLPPDKVLAAITPEKVGLHQRFLRWLIEDQDYDAPQYHTSYALSIAKSVLEEDHFDSEHGNIMRERLQLFLQASDLYSPEEVLDAIFDSELWLEKAILYRKMGQENIVLQILALKLEDSDAAEQYCAEIGLNDAYMQLLDLYLNPHDGKEPMFNAAVRLIHKHGQSLDPLQVLEKLSPEMPLQLASDTILRMLRARVHHHRQGQIVRNMSHAVNLDTKLARLEERSRHVQLNDESICSSCHARLGTKLFVMYPDDSVVCYRCYRNLGDSGLSQQHNVLQATNFKPGWLVTR